MKRVFHAYKGFEYIKDNRSLIVQLISMSKENILFSNTEIEKFIKITSEYFDSVSKNKNLFELFGKLEYVTSLSADFDGAFYKFIPKEIYDNYISKGKFQLGSLQYYREIERDGSRDEKEGCSNIIINSNNRHILTSAISGFNSYIFCGTYDLNLSDEMSKNFGGYILKIRNIKSFADKIKKAIGAVNWQIEKVTYTDYKAYQASIDTINLEDVGPDLSDELFDILYKLSERPSLFSKPTRFIPEQELRLTFTMNQKVKKRLNFDNLGLLNDIEIIKNFGRQTV